MKHTDEYTCSVVWSEEDQEFVGLCAELPSLSWLAKNKEEAWSGIINLVAKVINDMQVNDE